MQSLRSSFASLSTYAKELTDMVTIFTTLRYQESDLRFTLVWFDDIAYPPSDWDVGEFFGQDPPTYEDEQKIELRYKAFFTALFECAVTTLENALADTAGSNDSVPKRWHQYLASGASEIKRGENRRSFYQKVVKTATRVRILSWLRFLLQFTFV